MGLSHSASVIRPHVVQDIPNSLNGSWCTKCRTSGV